MNRFLFFLVISTLLFSLFSCTGQDPFKDIQENEVPIKYITDQPGEGQVAFGNDWRMNFFQGKDGDRYMQVYVDLPTVSDPKKIVYSLIITVKHPNYSVGGDGYNEYSFQGQANAYLTSSQLRGDVVFLSENYPGTAILSGKLNKSQGGYKGDLTIKIELSCGDKIAVHFTEAKEDYQFFIF